MKSTAPVPVGAVSRGRPEHRPHPLPRWLRSSSRLHAVARSRCLMVLSVLSGERSVSDAIAQAKISRATYYQLETRALNAILKALHPHSRGATAAPSMGKERIRQLEAQVKRLQQHKRRSDRLLLLMRKSLRAPLTRGLRGPWPKRPSTRNESSTSPGASLP